MKKGIPGYKALKIILAINRGHIKNQFVATTTDS